MNEQERQKYKNKLKKEANWKALLHFRFECGEVDHITIKHAAELGDPIAKDIHGVYAFSLNIYDVLKKYNFDFCLNAALYACELLIPHYHKIYDYDGKIEEYATKVKEYHAKRMSVNFYSEIREDNEKLGDLYKEINAKIWDFHRESKEYETLGNWIFKSNEEKIERLNKTSKILDAFVNLITISRSGIRDHYIRLTVDIYKTLNYITGEDPKKIFVDYLINESDNPVRSRSI